MNAKREARRKRDREDFVRITTQRLEDVGQHKHATSGKVGLAAGPTYREHLENKLEGACTRYRELDDPMSEKGRVLRGMIRGLAMALLIYEDSYNMNDKAKLLKIERSFME